MGIPQNQDPQQQEQQENSAVKLGKNFAKKKVKQAGKKAAKKVAKKAAALAKKALSAGLKALAKLLVSLVGTIGVPTILTVAGIILLIVIIMFVYSSFFGSGTDLKGEDQELYEYMIKELDKTIDTSRPEQAQYRIPPELLAAVVQSDFMMKEYEGKEKELIRKMAQALKPTFEYEDFNEYTEIYTETCEEGKCSKTKVKKKDHYVKKITYVDAWNGNATYEYDGKLSDWEGTLSTHNETRYKMEKVKFYKNWDEERGYFDPYWAWVPVPHEVKIETYDYSRKMTFEQTTVQQTEDYSTFDSILNQYGFSERDKKMVEALYEFSGGSIGYTEWLSGSGFGFSGGGFQGTVIPGGNVPAQFMEFYRKGEKAFGVDWYTLAAIHFVETSFSDSQNPSNVSVVGAIGPVQFMPLTWLGWSASADFGGTRLGNASIPTSVLTDPSKIKKYGGYGLDGNDDGKADPWSVADSMYSAASYLAKNGYGSDKRKAIYAYNHAEWYIDKVLKYAEMFHLAATYQPGEGMPSIPVGEIMAPATGRISTNYGWDTLNGKKRFHYGLDIGLGGRGNVPVVAFADGTVKKAYLSGSYGNCIIITHNIGGQPIDSLYAHLQNRNVVTGQKVKKGTFLGYMGNTGQSFGAHLHFELHKGSGWNAAKSNSFNPLEMVQIPSS
ncbi:peptidoglycan DD-metalloendopeptidase family protein [Rossellomorea arthrocnemi]|uniref:peptidoglycan DD-metalloendopeptidase family protein n=1 Tax=Rossellomorea arthrocnemi TaxID=2769542 RepID=UPI00191A2CCE|nr:peptidoglycan DD-metalloendopeptidase family protein [Rossellomorea arthrocnemi]